MVRISQILCRVRYHQRQRDVYRRKGIYQVRRGYFAPEILKGKGVEVHDVMDVVRPQSQPQIPWESLLPDFQNADLIQAAKPANTETEKQLIPVWHLSSRLHFSEGINQACLLSKAQRFDGLPKPIEQLVGKYSIKDQAHRICTVIRHSQQWDNTKQLLPKRLDKENMNYKYSREYGVPDSKAIGYMLHEFVRLAKTESSKFPQLVTQRRVMNKPEVHIQYQFSADDLIDIAVTSDSMVLGKKPLPAFGDPDLVRESVNYTIPDMYPINPTIDMEQKSVEACPNKPALSNIQHLACSHPQLILRSSYIPRDESNQAFNIMSTFATALAEARQRQDRTSGQLERPVTVMNVNASYNTLNFIVFQLNTLDISSVDGIKNFVWVDSSNKLFDRFKPQPWKGEEYKNTRYLDFDETPFQKFLAMYLYNYDS